MSSIEKALRIDFEDGGRSRRCQIHLPIGYPNRNSLVKLIREYGGDVQSHLAHADVVIVQDHISKAEGMQKRISTTHQCHATLVVEPWLHDCIDQGYFISPQHQRYTPSCLRRERSSAPTAAEKTSVNQRRLRADYTLKDEDAILQVLSVWKGTLLQAAVLLSKMREHTKQSFQTHLQANIGQGKHYDRRLEGFKRRLGEEGLQTNREQLLEYDPNVAELLDYGVGAQTQTEERDEDSLRISPEHRTRTSQRVDRSVQATPRNDTPPEPDIAAPIRIDTRNTPFMGASHAQSDTIITNGGIHQESLHSATTPNATTASIRRFLQEEREALIKQLALHLKSLYKDLPASQDGSVIGYLDSSQDVPEPPRRLFEHMSRTLPNHTSEEWRKHFSKTSNRVYYLDLAREELERMLLLERNLLSTSGAAESHAEEAQEESYDQLFDEMPSQQEEKIAATIRDNSKTVIKEEYNIEEVTIIQGQVASPDLFAEGLSTLPKRSKHLFFSSSQVDSEEEVDEIRDTQGIEAVNHVAEKHHSSPEEEIEDDEEEARPETEEDEIENSSDLAEEPDAGLSLPNGTSEEGDLELNKSQPSNANFAQRSLNRGNDSIDGGDYVLDDDDDEEAGRGIEIQRRDVESVSSSDQSVSIAERTVIYMPAISNSSSSRISTASSSSSHSQSAANTSSPLPLASCSRRIVARSAALGQRVSYATLARRMVPYVEIDNGNLRSPFNSVKSNRRVETTPLTINGYKRRRLSSSSIEEGEEDRDRGLERRREAPSMRGRGKEAARSENRETSGTIIHERLHRIVTSALDPSSGSRRTLKRLRLGSRPAKDRLDVLAEQYNIKKEIVDGYFEAVKQDYDVLESILKVPR